MSISFEYLEYLKSKGLDRLHRLDPTFISRYLRLQRSVLESNQLVSGYTFRWVSLQIGMDLPPGAHYTGWHAAESCMSSPKRLRWMVGIGKTKSVYPTNHDEFVTLYLSLIYKGPRA